MLDSYFFLNQISYWPKCHLRKAWWTELEFTRYFNRGFRWTEVIWSPATVQTKVSFSQLFNLQRIFFIIWGAAVLEIYLVRCCKFHITIFIPTDLKIRYIAGLYWLLYSMYILHFYILYFPGCVLGCGLDIWYILSFSRKVRAGE